MAKFAFILPRPEMVDMAGRIAAELDMEVVHNVSVPTTQVVAEALRAQTLGAGILVARGRQASILKENTALPVVELQLTGQEMALFLHRARAMVPQIPCPRIGIVTIQNMVGDLRYFDEICGIELHTYFVSGNAELEEGAARALEDGMDVIMGGDLVNEYCHRHNKLTLFIGSTDDSIRAGLIAARNVGFAADKEHRSAARLQTLLDYSFNGIIELDARGMILRANDIACKILDRERLSLLGVPLSSLMPEGDASAWEDTLKENREMYFSALELAGIEVVANAAPIKPGDSLEGIVFSFYELHSMEREGEQARRERYRLYRYLARGRFEQVDRESPEMQRIIKLARTFAATSQPILIQGEVGSRKSLFAQSIHNASEYAEGPFVTFHCESGQAGQGEALAQAEREANNGTLYLNRLDCLAPEGQHVLRQLIEEGVIWQKREGRPLPAQVRIIVSMPGELWDLVREGRFQPELYYLLVPMRLKMPPLRTRPDDLERTIGMCLDDCAARFKRYVVLTKEARRVLLEYPWPGNYTQLRAFMERLILTAPSRTINDNYVRRLLGELYPEACAASVSAPADGPASEAAALLQALARNQGNRAATAAELGISKTTLWRRMKRYGLQDHFESEEP